MRLLARGFQLMSVTALALVLATCESRPGLLDRITTHGSLRVATVNSATTYYLDAEGPTGFEYDLVRAFADHLGLELDIMVLPDRQAVLDAVASGRAHIGAGLATSETRRQRVRFTPAYVVSTMEAVYRAHQDKPEDLTALSGRLTLPGDSALTDRLRAKRPDIDFDVDDGANTEELMDRIAAGELETTIANADIVAMNQRYYPALRVAFDLPNIRQHTAWALDKRRPGDDGDGLYNQAIAFLERTKNEGRMRILHDRYFGHVQRLGFVGGQEFARQVEARLDRWRPHFKRAAEKSGLDWRLLAAVGYQESHWDEDAVSPTAVRGLMMLTRATAKEMGVTDRRDPRQSIDGGTRYLLQVRDRLPEEITEPDRTWFALAAYNVGYGHVMDARRLLAARNRNPNLWINLRDALPWLNQDRYLSETRYGYALGLEAAAYVGNIRAYYDILVWMTSDRTTEPPAALETEEVAGGAPIEDSADITIDSPAF